MLDDETKHADAHRNVFDHQVTYSAFPAEQPPKHAIHKQKLPWYMYLNSEDPSIRSLLPAPMKLPFTSVVKLGVVILNILRQEKAANLCYT